MATVQIPLTRGFVATIDAEDEERVLAQGKWQAIVVKNLVYAIHSRNRESSLLLHRFVMNAVSGIEIDHRDGNGLNCTKANLREATRSQQAWNTAMSRRNSSGYRGVSWDKGRGKWRATISANGSQFTLGRFDTAEEAARAYDEAAKRLHGEFASLNADGLRWQ